MKTPTLPDDSARAIQAAELQMALNEEANRVFLAQIRKISSDEWRIAAETFGDDGLREWKVGDVITYFNTMRKKVKDEPNRYEFRTVTLDKRGRIVDKPNADGLLALTREEWAARIS